MNIPSKILILFAHPAPQRSRVNHLMVQRARTLPNVTVRDLYEMYPDFDIDVKEEQALLVQADLIVFQHPIQWYSMPSLLKEWVDVVLEAGWAHGAGGTALHGKDFWLAVTTGGSNQSYQETGYHGAAFSTFLPPFQHTAALCGMHWLPPHILHDAHHLDDASVARHIDHYVAQLAAYSAGSGWAAKDESDHQHALSHQSHAPDLR